MLISVHNLQGERRPQVSGAAPPLLYPSTDCLSQPYHHTATSLHQRILPLFAVRASG